MTIEEKLKYYHKKYKDEARLLDEYFRYIKNGKQYKVKLPKLVRFIDNGYGLLIKPEPFNAIDYREPLAGEYYLSGAIVKAYLAKNSLSSNCGPADF